MSSRLLKTAFSIVALVAGLGAPAHADCLFEERAPIGEELNLPVHRWVKETDSKPQGIIVAVPGLVFSGKAYEELGKHFAEKNFHVYTIDLRGLGEWLKPNANFGADKRFHFTQSKDDLSKLLSTLREKYPDVPIFGLGESMGANYCLWEASTCPDLLDGAMLFSISYKVAVHPRPLWVKTFFQGLAHPKTPMNIVPYLEPTLSEDKQLVKKCLAHEDTCKEMSVEDLIKAAVTNRRTVQYLHQLPESMPILIVAGKKDKIQKTNQLHKMVSRMATKKAELVVLKNRGHLLVEHQKPSDEVFEVMNNWLATSVRPRTTVKTIAEVSSKLENDESHSLRQD
ncbi:alpha/beta hydrolase [Candidatus Obscuribacterales bacterium]|nr:alpha/beta hydrolase [Candidatus Obscuribacterales bacterium]